MKLLKICSTAKLLIILAGLSASSSLLAGEPFMLVSEEEYRMQLNQKNVLKKNLKFNKSLNFEAEQNFPLISISSPTKTSVLYSPIRVEINFKSADDANIQFDSLRVLYGWLNLDITDRIKEHAQVTAAGILAENVELPVGEHHITIEIMDTMKRRTEKEVAFEVLVSESN